MAINNRMLKFYSILIKSLYFILLFISVSNPQNRKYSFTHIDVENGLPQNFVNLLFQDSEGFIWLSTIEGLTKYDGVKFTTFKFPAKKSDLVSEYMINSIYETDENGEKILWLCLNSGGLFKFNANRIAFKHVSTDKEYKNTICNNTLYSIKGDNAGSFWIGSENGLIKLDTLNKIAFKYTLSNPYAKYKNQISQVLSVSDNAVYVISPTEGLLKFDRLKQRFDKIFDLNNFLKEDDYIRTAIKEPGNSQVFWMGTSKNGIIRFDLNTYRTNIFKHNCDDSSSINGNFIISILYDKDSTLWIGHLHEGISLLRTTEWRKGKFSHLMAKQNDDHSISNNSVYSLLQDSVGAVWVGTNGGGINIFYPYCEKFSHIKRDEGIKSTLMDNNIWSIYETVTGKDKTLWIGTNSGLSKLDRCSKTFENYIHSEKQLGSIPSGAVRAILKNSDSRILIGTLGGGIAELNTHTDMFTDLALKYKNKIITNNQIYQIYRDSEENIWIASSDGGLNKFSVDNSVIQNYPLVFNGDTCKWVTTIYEDDHKNIWLGTWKYGLICLPANNSQQVIQYKHILSDPYSLNNDIVFSIYQSTREPEFIWIATYGGGLSKFNIKEKKFFHYTTENGLCNDFVYSVLEDDFGFIWVSTNKGLSRLNPATGAFKKYDLENGLSNREFNFGAAFKSKSGELFWGGYKGIDYIRPENFYNPASAPIAITSIKIAGQKFPLNEPLRKIKSIDLSYNENFLSFDMLSLNYVSNEKSYFAYKLVNYDEDWNIAAKTAYAQYSHLPPGKYILQIKSENMNGDWTKPSKSIMIIIHPPYYTRWWFYLTGSIALFSILFIGYKIRIKRILELNEIRMEERLKVQKRVATDFHDELGFRLTGIVSLARDASQKNKGNDYVEEKTNGIINHAVLLNNEMRQMVWEIDPQKLSLFDLMMNLKRFADSIFDTEEISFSMNGIDHDLEGISLSFEWRQNLSRIFKEALHNINKHAKGCNSIELKTEVNKNYIQITLTDNGIGFDINNVSKGCGLNSMKERAQKLNGELIILSIPEKGTKVIFNGKLP